MKPTMAQSALALVARILRPIDKFLMARIFQPIDELFVSNPDLLLVVRTVCILSLIILLLLSIGDAFSSLERASRRRVRHWTRRVASCEDGVSEKHRLRRALILSGEHDEWRDDRAGAIRL